MATFVLVHGTTAGGWVWKTVAAQLEQTGHVVYRPTLTGLGERVHLLTREVGLDTHIADVVNHILYEELTDVVLVGHSYGGMVITGVADRVPDRIRELVYFDAVVPQDGESAVDLYGRPTYEHFAKLVADEGDGWLIPVQRGPNDLPAKNGPHPWKSWTDPITLTNAAATSVIPRTYVRFTADKQPGQVWDDAFAETWRRIRREPSGRGWRVRELDTMHQILPDPHSKAAILLELFPE